MVFLQMGENPAPKIKDTTGQAQFAPEPPMQAWFDPIVEIFPQPIMEHGILQMC